jgi:RNA polymerase sigma-70 factor (ECF subfamily)
MREPILPQSVMGARLSGRPCVYRDVTLSVSQQSAQALALGLFERHAGAVRRFMLRLTRDRGAADDLTGEVFLRVVKAAPAYEPQEREAAWVFRIAHNVARDFHRRRIRSVEDATAAEAAASPPQALSLDLQRGLDALPDDERVALLLGEVAGLTYAEIAAATDSTVPAVRCRIYRARQFLRARLVPPPAATPSLRGSHGD